MALQHLAQFAHIRRAAITMCAAIALTSCIAFAIACGSDDAQAPAAATVAEDAIITIGDQPDLRAHTRPSTAYTADDFINAGWKQNKEFSVETLPGATAALFGFFNRRDIELRIYPDRDTAMDAGQTSAETAIETNKLSGRGAGFSAVTLYGAYLIAGNVVMLCEISIDDCTALIDAVHSSN